MRFTLYSILVFFSLSLSLTAQDTQTFKADYTYRMGDNDTRTDAKRMAFLEAKNLCVEQAGVFLTSVIKSTVTETNGGINEKFNKDITSVATAVVKAKIIDEQQSYQNGTLEVTVWVEAQIDIEAAQKLFSASQNDPEISNQLELQQIQLTELQDKLSTIQKKMSVSTDDEAIANRVERKKILHEVSLVQDIQFKITSATKRAVDNVLIGMTKEEVIQVAGKPRSTDRYGDLNYGDVWVVLRNGLVKCVVKSAGFRSGKSCSSFPKAKIIKILE